MVDAALNINQYSSLYHSYMVDAADPEKIEASRNELHNLLDKQQLTGIPVLVLGNKRDLPNALDEKGLIERMCVVGGSGECVMIALWVVVRGWGVC